MEIKDIYLKSQSHKIISLDKSSDMLSHAYLLDCSDRYLLDEYAMLFAKEIFCLSNSSPCDECLSCQKIEHSNMVDLKVYPKDKNIVVDDIVDIVADSIQRPMDAINKVYILKNSDNATTQAQNKILKTLEEPPHNVIFILTASNIGAVLPTILSRVKTIHETPLDIETVAEFLKTKEISNAWEISLISNGNIATAMKLKSSTGADKIYDLAIDTLINLKSSADILKFSSKITSLKKDFVFFVDALVSILRDAKVLSCKEIVVNKDNLDKITQIGKMYSHNAVVEIVKRLTEIYNKLNFNCNLVAVVDKMLLDILEVKFLCQ